MKGAGQYSRLLADHGVHHKQDLMGVGGGTDAYHFGHHLLVDLQATGGVHQDRVKAFIPGLAHTCCGNRLRPFIRAKAEHVHAYLAAQGMQLVNGRRAIYIGSHQQRPQALLFKVESQLCCRCRFPGPLQTCQKDDAGT